MLGGKSSQHVASYSALLLNINLEECTKICHICKYYAVMSLILCMIMMVKVLNWSDQSKVILIMERITGFTCTRRQAPGR